MALAMSIADIHLEGLTVRRGGGAYDGKPLHTLTKIDTERPPGSGSACNGIDRVRTPAEGRTSHGRRPPGEFNLGREIDVGSRTRH